MGMAPIVTAMLHQAGHSQPQHSPVEMSVQSNPFIGKVAAENAIITTGRIVALFQKDQPLRGTPALEIYVLFACRLGVSILSTRLAI